MALHVVEQEGCCTAQYGIVLTQEGLVARKQIVLPKVGREPGATCREHPPHRTVYRSCHTPDIGIMVGHPTVAAVHLLRRLSPCLTEITEHREKWLCRLRQVTYLRDPVVHLGIDVDGVFRIPRRHQLVVPHPLQISRLSAWL